MFKIGLQSPPSEIYRHFRRENLRRMHLAMAYATDKAAKNARAGIRGRMQASGLRGLSNAISYGSDLRKRGDGLPGVRRNGGFKSSGFVAVRHRGSERTKGAIKAYTEGVVITAKRAKWLAFPSRQIPQRVNRFKMTPARYIAAGYERSIGKLVFVRNPVRPHLAYLIINNPRTGRSRKSTGNIAEPMIIAFILIRRTRRENRVKPESIYRFYSNRVPRYMREYMNRDPYKPIASIRAQTTLNSFGRP